MMRIGVIACEVLKRQLEPVIKGDSDIVYSEYLEFGLHEYPEELKRVVVEKVNALEGKVDAVLLGYGICNSLRDITDQLRVPTARLEADDCIGVILTPSEYEKERKKCAGTAYHTPYAAQMGKGWFERDLRKKMPNYEELGIDVDWYMDKMFNGYSRVLFIDDGLENIDDFKAMSKQFADEMGFRYESRYGTLSLLIDALDRTKALARAHAASS